MSAEDTDRLRGVLAGTGLKMPDGPVTCRREQVTFQNSGGMLADDNAIYGDVLINTDVDVYLAGDTAVAVATMRGGTKDLRGRVTVGVGKAVDVKPFLDELMGSRHSFADFFEPLHYQHSGKH